MDDMDRTLIVCVFLLLFTLVILIKHETRILKENTIEIRQEISNIGTNRGE